MTRGADSKINPGDKVKVIGYGSQVKQWAVGLEGTVDRINRQGGIIVNLGFTAKQKYITAKREHLKLIGGMKVKADKEVKFKNKEKNTGK